MTQTNMILLDFQRTRISSNTIGILYIINLIVSSLNFNFLHKRFQDLCLQDEGNEIFVKECHKMEYHNFSLQFYQGLSGDLGGTTTILSYSSRDFRDICGEMHLFIRKS